MNVVPHLGIRTKITKVGKAEKSIFGTADPVEVARLISWDNTYLELQVAIGKRSQMRMRIMLPTAEKAEEPRSWDV